MKALFLLFHTDYLAEVVRADVKDGRALIGHKEIIVKDARPFLVKTMFGAMPLYMINWETCLPIGIKDLNIYETPITPEMLKRSVELKLWHFLLKRFRAELEFGMNWFYFFLATVLGMIVMYLLFHFHVIHL
jgi:hypothetical protein